MDTARGCLPKAGAGGKKWMLYVTSHIWQNSMLIGDLFFPSYLNTHIWANASIFLKPIFLAGNHVFPHYINAKAFTYVLKLETKTNITIRLC